MGKTILGYEDWLVFAETEEGTIQYFITELMPEWCDVEGKPEEEQWKFIEQATLNYSGGWRDLHGEEADQVRASFPREVRHC